MAASVAMDDTTCFVRNLPFSINDDKLTEMFSEIGPVKKAFLVREKGSDKHKGYGFVTFALKEDAEKAAKKLGGKKEDGRTLQVEVAKKRAALDVRNGQRAAKGEKPFEPRARGKAATNSVAVDNATEDASEPEESAEVEAKPTAQTARTPAPAPVAQPSTRLSAFDKAELCKSLAIGNIPEGFVDKVTRKARAMGSVKTIDDPAPPHLEAFAKLRQDGCEGHTVIVRYTSGRDAFHAVWKLHGREIGGAKLWARQLNGEGANVKKWRVILRNLPFGVTEEELAGVFGKIGFVWSVSIPKMDNGKMKGFAFVSFTCRAHAERAILAVNGKEWKGRIVVADWSLARAAFKDATASPLVPEAFHGDTYGHDAPGPGDAEQAQDGSSDEGSDGGENQGEDNQGEQGDSDQGEDDDGEGSEEGAVEVTEEERGVLSRVLDDVMAGKEKGRKEKGDAKSKGDAKGEIAAKAGKLAEAALKDSTAAAAAAAVGVVDSEAEGDKKGDSKAEAKAAKAEAKAAAAAASAAAKGTVVKSAAEVEAMTEWEGPRARAEGGGASTSGRGSGEIKTQVFVRNLPAEVTVIQLSTRLARFGPIKACRLVMNKATGKPKGTAFVEYDTPEGALKAVASSKAYAEGSGPGVSLRDKQLIIDAALVQDSARSLAATGSAKSVPADKRNLYLAKEGVIEESSAQWEALSTNDQNRRRGAAAERKLKLASPNFFVSPTRLHFMNVPQGWDEKTLKEACRVAIIERASKSRPKMKQVIILRDKTRLDEGGEMKSRGLAFIEFETHEDALVCLRQMNNNPGLFGGAQKRPIVEFAIESVKILKIRDRKIRLQQELVAGRAAAESAEPGEEVAAESDDAERIRLRGLKRKERNDRRKRERYEKERGFAPREAPAYAGAPEGTYDDDDEPEFAAPKAKRVRRKDKIAMGLIPEDAPTPHTAHGGDADDASGAGGGAGGVGGAGGENVKKRSRRKGKDGVDSAPAEGATGDAHAVVAQAGAGGGGERAQKRVRQAGLGGKGAEARGDDGPAEGGVQRAAGPGKQRREKAQQEEASHQKQQRSMDAAVDALAGEAVAAGGRQKRSKKKAETDATDDLITKRTRALFGLSAKGAAKPAASVLNARWFEDA